MGIFFKQVANLPFYKTSFIAKNEETSLNSTKLAKKKSKLSSRPKIQAIMMLALSESFFDVIC